MFLVGRTASGVAVHGLTLAMLLKLSVLEELAYIASLTETFNRSLSALGVEIPAVFWIGDCPVIDLLRSDARV